MCIRYPAFVLTPSFGSWTFGPVAQETSSSKCCKPCQSNVLSISYLHTWVNYAISLIGIVLTFLAEIESRCSGRYTHVICWSLKPNQTKYDRIFEMASKVLVKGTFFASPWNRIEGAYDTRYESSMVASWIIMFFILPVILIFTQTLDKCKKCFCKCCQTRCFPVIESSELDVDNIEELQVYEDDEESIQGSCCCKCCFSCC